MLLIILLACNGPDTSDSSADPGESGDDTSTGDTTDTSPPAPEAAATLSEGGVVTCADPDARDRDGPFVPAWGGDDWQGQLVPEKLIDRPNSRGVVVADINGDGRLDIYLPNMAAADQLFIDQGDQTWADEAAERWPGDESALTAGATAVDVDDDGDLDLLTYSRGGPNALYLNDGDGFFTLAEGAGLAEQDAGSVTSTWGDMDGDGDLDLYIGAHFSVGDEGLSDEGLPAASEPGELYENVGGGAFVDRSDDLPASSQDGFTYAASWLDIDDDGDQDLYLVNDFGAYWRPNVLLENTLESGSFGLEEATEGTGLDVAMAGMGLGIGDINGDGAPDLLASGWDQIVLLESFGDGTWYDSALSRGLVHDDERHVAWGLDLLDIDNDGDLDAPVSFGFISLPSLKGLESPQEQPDALFLQDDDGQFVQSAESWNLADRGVNRGFAAADLNGDGFLDLIKTDLNGPRRMFISRCSERTWLRVALTQPAPNVDAVGARVVVTADGAAQTRWVLAGGTNLNTSAPIEAHFGLGDSESADVAVIWPDGATSTFEGVSARQVIQVTRTE